MHRAYMPCTRYTTGNSECILAHFCEPVEESSSGSGRCVLTSGGRVLEKMRGLVDGDEEMTRTAWSSLLRSTRSQ